MSEVHPDQPAFTPWRFSSFDGASLSFVTARPPAHVRVRPVPVLLHHGFAASAQLNWIAPDVVGRLLESGRRVIAFDARGHGLSDKPHDPARYADGAMARDVGRLLDVLAVSAVDLVGYSMGAAVAYEVASYGDSRLRSLTLGGVGAAITRGGGIDREAIAAAFESADPEAASDATIRALARIVRSTGGDFAALAALMRAPRRAPGDPSGVDLPTLVLAGRDDPLAEGAERLAAAIPGATVARVPGDHLSAVAEPGFTAELIAFLDDLDVRAPRSGAAQATHRHGHPHGGYAGDGPTPGAPVPADSGGLVPGLIPGHGGFLIAGGRDHDHGHGHGHDGHGDHGHRH